MPSIPTIELLHPVQDPPQHVRVLKRLLNSLPTQTVTIGPTRTRVTRVVNNEQFYCGANVIHIVDVDPDVEPGSITVTTSKPFVRVLKTILDPRTEPAQGRAFAMAGQRLGRSLRISLIAHPPDTDRVLGEPKPNYVGCGVTISYTTTGACWHPKYSFVLDTEHGTAELKTSAYILNKTSEIWRDCRVVFSTSALRSKKTRGAEPPVLTPWKIGLRQLRSGADGLVQGSTKTLQEKIKDEFGTLEEEEDEKEQEGFAIAPDLEIKRIPSPGKWSQRVEEFRDSLHVEEDIEWRMQQWTIGTTQNGPVELLLGVVQFKDVSWNYTVVPKYDERAYMNIYFTNTTEIDIMSGPVSITVDRQTMKPSTLPRARPGEKVNLNAGPDPWIAVSYSVRHESASYDRQLGQGQNHENVTRVCRLENLRIKITRPTSITVVDQLPMCDDPGYGIRPAFPANMRLGGEAVGVTLENVDNDKSWARRPDDNEWGTASAKVDVLGEVRVFIELNPYKRVRVPLSWHVSVPGGYRLVEL